MSIKEQMIRTETMSSTYRKNMITIQCPKMKKVKLNADTLDANTKLRS